MHRYHTKVAPPRLTGISEIASRFAGGIAVTGEAVSSTSSPRQEPYIAGLVEDGLTNAGIAAWLWLQTVDYLRKVFAKPGITLRTELASRLPAHG